MWFHIIALKDVMPREIGAIVSEKPAASIFCVVSPKTGRRFQWKVGSKLHSITSQKTDLGADSHKNSYLVSNVVLISDIVMFMDTIRTTAIHRVTVTQGVFMVIHTIQIWKVSIILQSF
jgi:hypothetical protein